MTCVGRVLKRPTLRVTSVRRKMLPATTVRAGVDRCTTLTGSLGGVAACAPAAQSSTATTATTDAWSRGTRIEVEGDTALVPDTSASSSMRTYFHAWTSS